MATIYSNLGEPGLTVQYARKAFELRDQVSERERFSLEVRYHSSVERNQIRAIEILELWAKTYPRDWRPSNSLCNIYSNRGEHDKAIEPGREALRRNPNHPFPYSNLGWSYAGLGRFAEARDVWEQAFSRGFATVPTVVGLYELAVLADDAASADRYAQWARGHTREYQMTEARGSAKARFPRNCRARWATGCARAGRSTAP